MLRVYVQKYIMSSNKCFLACVTDAAGPLTQCVHHVLLDVRSLRIPVLSTRVSAVQNVTTVTSYVNVHQRATQCTDHVTQVMNCML